MVLTKELESTRRNRENTGKQQILRMLVPGGEEHKIENSLTKGHPYSGCSVPIRSLVLFLIPCCSRP